MCSGSYRWIVAAHIFAEYSHILEDSDIDKQLISLVRLVQSELHRRDNRHLW